MMPDSLLVMGILGTAKIKVRNRNDVFDATDFLVSLLKVLCCSNFISRSKLSEEDKKKKKLCVFSFPVTKSSVSKIKPQYDQFT